MGTSGLHSSTFVTRTSAFLSLFPFCFCSSPGVAPLLTQTQRPLAGSLSECGLWSHSHKEQYALLTQTQRPLAGSLSECGLWSHSHKELYVFMQQSCSFSWFSWLHILRQSGELKGNRTGCWNESPFVKSESVTCSVVSDSLRPHGLYPPRLLCPWHSPSRQEYWSGSSCPSPGDLPNQSEPPGKPESTFSSV